MKIISKILVSGLLALLIWELILQNTIISTTGYSNHPVMGKILNEGTYLQGSEGFSRTKIFPNGVVGKPVPSDMNERYRILVLGDSFTEGVQVSDQDKYSNLTELILKEKGFSEVITINLGRSYASPAHYLHLANYYNNEYKPNYVVVEINDGDFSEMLSGDANFFVKKNGDGFKTFQNTHFASNNEIAQKLKNLYFLLNYSTVRIGADKLQKFITSTSSKTQDTQEIRTNSKEPSHYDESLIAWTMETLKKNYNNVLVIYIPTLNYQYLNEPPSIFEEKVQLYGEKVGVNVINMRETFVNNDNNRKWPSYGFYNTKPGVGHINEIGHKLIALKLVSFFEGRILK
ncbi:hypothetical protein [Paenibacillus sp. HJGM_3]|uniref:hypothetical protein n=1 Tax=Paenibacillus sp. HJGM_3 TaxID=3379816 RepID=UPI0038598C02